MQRLSSPSTFFYKRVFPVFWFGIIGVSLFIGVTAVRAAARPDAWPALLAPLLMAVIGFVPFKYLLADLVDEVWLDGDQLVVKNRGEQSRLALGDVINVNASTMTNPPRITLMLRNESSRFGKNVSFIPAGPRSFLGAFKPNPIATDLIQRIDSLRRRPV
jgi:hypothetical protein